MAIMMVVGSLTASGCRATPPSDSLRRVEASGPGDAVPGDRPESRAGTDQVIAMDIGTDRSCAVHRSGRLSCRGNQRSPRMVPVIDDAIDVLVRGARPCALRASGQVWCWEHDDRPRPLPLDTPGDVVQIAGDAYGAVLCLLHRDRTLSCQPRDGSGPARIVPGVADAVRVVGGDSHICVGHANGEVSCWSVRSLPGASPVPPPTAVHRLPAVSDAQTLALGRDVLCAVVSAGGVRCWDLDARNTGPFLPREVPRALGPVDRLVVGDSWACAREQDGQVTCWGGQPWQVPDAVRSNREVHRVAGLSRVTSLFGGGMQLCAAQNGAMWCMGLDTAGQIGDGYRSVEPGDWSEIELSPLRGLDVSSEATCALTDAGEVTCWGTRASWTRPTVLGTFADAAQISVSDAAVCIRTVTGTALCRGFEGAWLTRDLRGHDPIWRAPQPPISGAIDLDLQGTRACTLHAGHGRCWSATPLADVDLDGLVVDAGVQLAMSGAIEPIYVRQDDGSVRCLGETGCVDTSGLIDVSAIAAGMCHLCALTRKGELWCGGCNIGGVLGIPGRPPVLASTPPARVAGQYAAIAAAAFQTCAIRLPDRGVVCWGSSRLDDPARQRMVVPVGRDASAISAGPHHACAAVEGGRVVCWGSENLYGELGNGRSTALVRPTLFPLPRASPG